jgi:two-component system response regulator (stage 0 sporulation protein A)
MIDEVKISEILKELGIPANIVGYIYSKYAIELVAQDISYLRGVTYLLYPAIAKKFDVTASKVERGIRHAIEVGWVRGDEDFQYTLFGNTIDGSKGKPTNAEFIATVADWLNMNCEKKK